MRVFVTGASGYIGLSVAIALRRAGHYVFGLVRSEAKALPLSMHEIEPVIGEIVDVPTKFQEIINKCDVVIDCVLATIEGKTTDYGNRCVMDAVSKAPSRRRYIYCSGCLVYGNNEGKILEESDELLSEMTWRVQLEKDVTSSSSFHGVVLRPGFVYGGSGGHYITSWYDAPSDTDKLVIRGNPKKMWSWVHVEDLALAFKLVAEAPSAQVAGEIFNVGDSSRCTYEQVLLAMANANGTSSFSQCDYQPPADDWFSKVAMEVTTVMSANKIKHTLGWQPANGPFLDNIALYYKACKAHQKMHK